MALSDDELKAMREMANNPHVLIAEWHRDVPVTIRKLLDEIADLKRQLEEERAKLILLKSAVRPVIANMELLSARVHHLAETMGKAT